MDYKETKQARNLTPGDKIEIPGCHRKDLGEVEEVHKIKARIFATTTDGRGAVFEPGQSVDCYE